MRLVLVLLAVQHATALNAAANSVAAASISQEWRWLWFQATQKAEERAQTGKANHHSDKPISMLAERYRRTPEEFEHIAAEMNQALVEVLNKGDKLMAKSSMGQSGTLDG